MLFNGNFSRKIRFPCKIETRLVRQSPTRIWENSLLDGPRRSGIANNYRANDREKAARSGQVGSSPDGMRTRNAGILEYLRRWPIAWPGVIARNWSSGRILRCPVRRISFVKVETNDRHVASAPGKKTRTNWPGEWTSHFYFAAWPNWFIDVKGKRISRLAANYRPNIAAFFCAGYLSMAARPDPILIEISDPNSRRKLETEEFMLCSVCSWFLFGKWKAW